MDKTATEKQSELSFRGVRPTKQPKAGRKVAPGAGIGPSASDFDYQGGLIVTCPQVYLTFWGTGWQSRDGEARRDKLEQYVADLLRSEQMNVLTQYSVGFGAGLSGRVVDSSLVTTAPAQITATAPNRIQDIVQGMVNAATIPEPTNPTDSVLVIFLDDNIEVAGSFGQTMCEPTSDTAFGFHDVFNTAAGNPLVFAIVPGLTDACLTNSCPGGNPTCSLQTTQAQLDRITQVTSHELCEMFSDPSLDAWTGSSSGENGDICNGESGSISVAGRQWNVQRIYSEWDDHETSGTTDCLATVSTPRPRIKEWAQATVAGKLILGETALGPPALARLEQTLFLGWTGTDSNHHVNVVATNNGEQFVNKVTLGETSIDGPALAAGDEHLYLGWTGTDSSHSLNVLTSTDGQAFANKITLSERSHHAPALAYGFGSSPRIFLAWTGTDSRLNLLWSTDGVTFGNKVTLSETSVAAPGLAWRDGDLYLAWAGTDGNHSLNVMKWRDTASSLAPLFADKLTLGDSTEMQPALTDIAPFDVLFLGWSGRDSNHHLNATASFDRGDAFGLKLIYSDLGQFGPALADLNEMVYIAWTGRDSSHHVNLAHIT
jgi:hypothetical protein